MEQAFAFLAEATDLEPGRYELENGLFATVSEGETKPFGDDLLEAHKKYIDLQCVLAGGERLGWAHINEVNLQEADPEHDNYFYGGEYTALFVHAGMFYIMLPGDAHMPGRHRQYVNHYKKVVVKLPVVA